VADLLRKRAVSLPKSALARTFHSALKRLETIILFVVQSGLDGIVGKTCREIGLDMAVERVRCWSNHIQFFHLLRRQCAHGAFDFLASSVLYREYYRGRRLQLGSARARNGPGGLLDRGSEGRPHQSHIAVAAKIAGATGAGVKFHAPAGGLAHGCCNG
jgi:hypothetical protein